MLYDPDEHTGYCVTWAALYATYRILNMNVSLENLVNIFLKILKQNNF